MRPKGIGASSIPEREGACAPHFFISEQSPSIRILGELTATNQVRPGSTVPNRAILLD
jgi:hypothetical protein